MNLFAVIGQTVFESRHAHGEIEEIERGRSPLTLEFEPPGERCLLFAPDERCLLFVECRRGT